MLQAYKRYIRKNGKYIFGFLFLFSLLVYGLETREGLYLYFLIIFPQFCLLLYFFEERNSNLFYLIRTSDLSIRSYVLRFLVFSYLVTLFGLAILLSYLVLLRDTSYIWPLGISYILFSFLISHISFLAYCVSCGLGRRKTKLLGDLTYVIMLGIFVIYVSSRGTPFYQIEGLAQLTSFFLERPLFYSGLFPVLMGSISFFTYKMAILEIRQIEF